MKETPSWTVRPLLPAEEPFLWEMLYQAIYVPPGEPPLPRCIVRQPDLARYVEGWGRPGDMGFVAVDPAGQSAGAAWLRLWTAADHGYGYVDAETPELSVAVLPAYRGQGAGSLLLARLLEAAASRYPAVSLSVSPGNPALKLYERLGFQPVGASSGSRTMIKRF